MMFEITRTLCVCERIYDSGVGDLRINVNIIIVYLCLYPNCISNLAWSVIKVTCNIVERSITSYIWFDMLKRERGNNYVLESSITTILCKVF